MFIICLDYILRKSIQLIKENGFTLKKQEADNMTNEDYVDDFELLAKTPANVESLRERK